MSMVTKGERAKVKMALSEHHTEAAGLKLAYIVHQESCFDIFINKLFRIYNFLRLLYVRVSGYEVWVCFYQLIQLWMYQSPRYNQQAYTYKHP